MGGDRDREPLDRFTIYWSGTTPLWSYAFFQAAGHEASDKRTGWGVTLPATDEPPQFAVPLLDSEEPCSRPNGGTGFNVATLIADYLGSLFPSN